MPERVGWHSQRSRSGRDDLSKGREVLPKGREALLEVWKGLGVLPRVAGVVKRPFRCVGRCQKALPEIGRGCNALLESREDSGGTSNELGGVRRARRDGEGW